MTSNQHIYRRGHIFWWRRIHRISCGRPLDIRLSLKTFDRNEACNRGAALTAATGEVLRMLEQKIRAADARPTETDLQNMARQAYEELLADIMTQQRSRPWQAIENLTANQAMIDYYQRLADQGGHASLTEADVDIRLDAGWHHDRIANMAQVVRLREEGVFDPFPRDYVERLLRHAGFTPTDELRWMVELVLYEASRNAYQTAQKPLLEALDAGLATQSGEEAPAAEANQPEPFCVPPSPAPTTVPSIPEDWASLTPTQAAERFIKETPGYFEHRREGKRARAVVGEQTLRQIRWAAALLERSMGDRPLWSTTMDDLARLDKWFDRLPVTCGKSPNDRDPSVTLDEICARAADRVEDGELGADSIGFEIGTANKHFRKLRDVHDFMRKTVPAVPPLAFADFIMPDIKDERAARAAYTVEQGRELFGLAPWTGCASVEDRLSPGRNLYHDCLFFVLLLVWYTGMRREEVCKLLISDVEEYAGIWHLNIRFTEAGRVKNTSSVRLVALSDEMIRLGFVKYHEAIKAAGHDALFPELVSVRAGAKKGDTFYKLWWIYLRPLMPSLKRGQAMHAARHMVDTELKELEVFPEFRNDALGHKNEGEGPSRYSKATRLARLKALVDQIPVVTDHLPDCLEIRLLPPEERRPRQTRRTSS